MVGIPRSKGCRTCVTRRVRCDLGKPVCNNCQKGNRDCHYSEGLKFVNESTKLKRKFEHRNKEAAQDAGEFLLTFDTGTTSSSSNGDTIDTSEVTYFDDGHNGSIEPDEANTTVMFQGNTLFSFLEGNKFSALDVLDGDALGPSSALMDDTNVIFPNPTPWDWAFKPSPNIAQDQLFSIMHQSFFPIQQVLSVPVQLKTHGLWFHRLPPMTGRNRLLDAAVRAVSLVHLGRLQGSRTYIEESKPWYGATLRQLNAALGDNEEGMAPETLAATILLSFYEMFASNSNQSWIQHAGGAGALMRARGPEAHRFGFDREMFIAYRHTIIIEACQRDEPCFLAEPEWRELSKSIFHDLRASGEARFVETFDLAEMMFECMLDLPDLLFRSKHFRTIQKQEKFKFPTIRDFVGDLIERCQKLRNSFKTFFVRFKNALNETGFMWTTYLSHDPVIPIYYQFPNIFVGSSVTGYWTINILLNMVLIELIKEHAPEKISLYRAENRDSALELCRSVRFMLSSSFLGPFFIIFGLRIALVALHEKDQRDWVIARLFEISNTHMAMAAHIPGFEPGTDMPRIRNAISSTGGGDMKVIEIWD